MNRENYLHIPDEQDQEQLFRSWYKQLLAGQECSPRGLKIKEIENFNYEVPPFYRFINFKSRGLNLAYIKEEFKWYLGGNLYDLSISERAKIWKDIIQYKDGQGFLNSNYGYYVFTNGGLNWVVSELIRDRDSRRASLTILDRRHMSQDTRDFPCNYGINFRIRNNELKMTVHGRAQDAVYGLGVDLPCFSFFHEIAYILLKETYPDLQYGRYHHFVDSFHVYERHFNMLHQLTQEQNPEKLELVFCPRISSVDEVRFLLACRFKNETIPDDFLFTKWLMTPDENIWNDHILD